MSTTTHSMLADASHASARRHDASTRSVLTKLKCIVAGHAWRIDMDPHRKTDTKLCVRCRREKEF